MIVFPRPVPTQIIEREGRRLGFEHEDLEDFVEIVAAFDDYDIELTMCRLDQETKARAARKAGHA